MCSKETSEDDQEERNWKEIHEPFYSITVFHLAHELGSLGNVDIEVEFKDGRRYVAVFATIENLQSLMDQYRDAGHGECASGLYVWCTDLVVIREMTSEVIREVVRDLVDNEEIGSAMTLASDAD